MAAEQRNFLWLDMEMSGLDESTCHILEVAAIITNQDFQELETYEAVVFQPQAVLDAMDAWCTKHHGESGLTALVKTGKPESQVEQELLALVTRHFKTEEKPVLCGNSIGQDRKFIDAYLKQFSKRLHYRSVDVSSFKEIFRTLFATDFKKSDQHRALGDIRESIAELRHYLSFVTPPKIS